MWHPFKNKAVRVDSSQVISVVKDPGVMGGRREEYLSPPRYIWNPNEYEKLIKTTAKGAVIVIGVYMGCDTIRKCAINMSIDMVPLVYGTVADAAPVS